MEHITDAAPTPGTAAPRTAILVNRQSGTVRSMGEDAARKLIVAAFPGEDPEILLVAGAEIDGTVKRLLEAGKARHIIVGGGDGTVASVAGLLAGSGIALGILPLGTMNLMANALGISSDPAEALQQLRQAEEHDLDAARAGGRLFLHHVSFGLQPRMVRLREKLGYSSRLTKMLAGLRAWTAVLLKPHAQRFRLDIDGRRCEIRSPSMLVSNNIYENSVWLKQTRLDEGVLGIYAVRPMATLAYLRLALDLLRGRWRDNLNVTEEHARSVTLDLPSRRFGRKARSIRATLDGELTLFDLPLTITSDPAAVKMLVPRRSAT